MARSEETRAAWLEALAEMERLTHDVGDGSYAPPAWSPRADLGPLPPELAERARSVQTAQRAAIERVKDARRTVVAHLAALRTVPSARDTERSVYLDVRG